MRKFAMLARLPVAIASPLEKQRTGLPEAKAKRKTGCLDACTLGCCALSALFTVLAARFAGTAGTRKSAVMDRTRTQRTVELRY